MKIKLSTAAQHGGAVFTSKRDAMIAVSLNMVEAKKSVPIYKSLEEHDLLKVVEGIVDALKLPSNSREGS